MHRPSVPGPVQVIAGEPLRGQRLCRRLERLGFAVQANAPQGPEQAGTEAGHAPDAGTVLLLDLGGPPAGLCTSCRPCVNGRMHDRCWRWRPARPHRSGCWPSIAEPTTV
jgi:hypothetical protein